MLIGCITGPDFETAKSQIAIANDFCDGIELRQDLLHCEISALKPYAKGVICVTEKNTVLLSDGRKISIYHNFEGTPQNLQEILDSLPSADIYKIATMANSISDSLRMLNFVKDKPNVAGMCMGLLGQITRILSPIVSNPLTFAAVGLEAAPGQLQVEELLGTYNFRSLSPQTRIFGLIGNPISQSPSHRTHNAYFKNEKIDAIYVKMLVAEDEVGQVVNLAKELGFQGLSVTLPYKEKILQFIDVVEQEAEEIGAVNTLTLTDKIFGSNTDGKGALDAIEEKQKIAGKNCVILGAGGSSKAIAYEAEKRGATVLIHSRRFENMDHIPPYDILINTTSVPDPIKLTQLLPNRLVMDINVAHQSSLFMQKAKELGCTLVFGMEMFQKQAQGQFERWGLKRMVEV